MWARKALADSYEPRWSAPDPQRSLLLALQSVAAKYTIAGDATLREILWHLSLPRPAIDRGDEPPEAPAFRSRRVPNGPYLVAMGPNAGWLASGLDKETVVNRAGTRTFVRAKPGELDLSKAARVESVASPERTLGRADGTLTLKETKIVDKEGHVISEISPEWPVRHAAFDAQGHLMMTLTGRVSMDSADSSTHWYGSTFNIWEVETGRKVSDLSFAQYGGIIDFIVGPDNRWVAIVSGEDTFVMPIWPDDLVKEACRMATRQFHFSESDAYLTLEDVTGCPKGD